MSKGRSLGAMAAAVTLSVALAACGGGGGASSSGPSTLDPANMVPGTALEYVAITVRPRGTLKTELTQSIDAVAGAGTTKHLVAQLDKELATADNGVFSQIQSWVGERIGLALTEYPQNLNGGLQGLLDDILIVAPTNNPSAAKSFLANHFNSAGETGSVVGNYAIFGGQVAVGAALAATRSTSLASSPIYQAEIRQLGPNQLLTLFSRQGALDLHLLPALRAEANVNPVMHADLPTLLREVKKASDSAFAVSASPYALRLDVVQRRPGISGPHAPSALSGLPGDSWLAMHFGGMLANKGYLHLLTQIVPAAIAQGKARTGTTLPSNNPTVKFVERDLLPALGPLSVAVSGTTQATARLGVELAPANTGAGGRLVAGIRSLLSKSAPVKTGESQGRVLLTYGYRTVQDFLTPASKLGSDPAYRAAAAKLPPGSKPDMYLNFGPINALMLLDHNPKDATVKRILGKFNYVIAGGTPTHFRLIFAVR